MAVKQINGNIFNSKCQTIVNTVNCVGVMGKGIALVHKLRYPYMYEEYREHCKNKLIKTGTLWLYNKQQNAPWILSFPTKFHWKYPSKIEWVEQGLQKFVETYEKKGITSIAFPLLGTHNGGLDTNEVRKLMVEYLEKCNIDIEIYDYDPNAPDDLFSSFKTKWLSLNKETIKSVTGIQPQYARKITEILDSGEINSMVALANYKGIGEKTLEKAFGYVLNVQK
ncbi:macro domain-containing protein [Winogradskyella sediminis]|uniref:O-acetyl-ADP-ribose deacetylase (Regulator of RNase III), contains Macro domain n=1 Tax=Winogradskyella sediminis TaxID=1382466 RepID=A0A1H1X4Y7_9FLAO|nr:macro domain-containing protein [Winogradskyella sediminis]SDT04131.1 O-acetyl-ADP-ribose deacetylase (regulator of RNase III), contains Macro domain [Winogradskyella sediminis]